jgi:hypothetical protein
MSKNRKIVIGVIVAVVLFLGLGLLRWSSMVYWRSGGQRGFSVGAATYQLMGWGVDNYMADMGLQPGEDGWTTEVAVQLVDDNGDGVFDRGVMAVPAGMALHSRFGRSAGQAIPSNDVQLVDADGDGVPDRGVINYSAQSRYGKFGPHGFDRGFGSSHRGPGCFFLLLVLGAIGGGIYFYRRRRASTSMSA